MEYIIQLCFLFIQIHWSTKLLLYYIKKKETTVLRTLHGAAAGQVSLGCFLHVDTLIEHAALDLSTVQVGVYR